MSCAFCLSVYFIINLEFNPAASTRNTLFNLTSKAKILSFNNCNIYVFVKPVYQAVAITIAKLMFPQTKKLSFG